MEQWLITYTEYTDAELTSEIEWLRKQTRNPFGSQSEGNRSVTRATAEFRDRLAAASQVKTSRSQGASNPRHGIADFSQVRVR